MTALDRELKAPNEALSSAEHTAEQEALVAPSPRHRIEGFVEEISKHIEGAFKGASQALALNALSGVMKSDPKEIGDNLAKFVRNVRTSLESEGRKILDNLESMLKGENPSPDEHRWQRELQDNLQALWKPLVGAVHGVVHRLVTQPLAEEVVLEPVLSKTPQRLSFEGFRAKIRSEVRLDQINEGELLLTRDKIKYELGDLPDTHPDRENLVKRLFSVQEIRLRKGEQVGTLSEAEKAEALADMIQCGVELLKPGEAFAIGRGEHNLIPLSKSSAQVHAVVIRDDNNALWIKNLAQDGTTVNGEALHGITPLLPGSAVQFTHDSPVISILPIEPRRMPVTQESHLLKFKREILSESSPGVEILNAKLKAAQEELTHAPVGSPSRPHHLREVMKLQTMRLEGEQLTPSERSEALCNMLQCSIELLKPGESFTIGRGRENLINVTDEKASRKHATIFRDRTGHLWVQDTSSNGTQLNGESIQEITHLSGSVVLGIAGENFALSAFRQGSMKEVASQLVNDARNYLIAHHLLHGVASDREFSLRFAVGAEQERWVLRGSGEGGMVFTKGDVTHKVGPELLSRFAEANPDFVTTMSEFSRRKLGASSLTKIVVTGPVPEEAVARGLKFNDKIVVDDEGNLGQVKSFSRGVFHVQCLDGSSRSITSH